MRCDQVTREIATPTGLLGPGDLAAHLAACPSCASYASRAARLDRLWEQTRPDDLPAGALDALWARAAVALDAAPPASIPMPRRSGRRWARVAIALASAAAVLGPVLLATRPPAAPQSPAPGAPAPEAPAPRPEVAARALPRVEIGVDETVVIRIGDDGPRVLVLDNPSEPSPDAFPSLAAATPHDVMNALESLAQ